MAEKLPVFIEKGRQLQIEKYLDRIKESEGALEVPVEEIRKVSREKETLFDEEWNKKPHERDTRLIMMLDNELDEISGHLSRFINHLEQGEKINDNLSEYAQSLTEQDIQKAA